MERKDQKPAAWHVPQALLNWLGFFASFFCLWDRAERLWGLLHEAQLPAMRAVACALSVAGWLLVVFCFFIAIRNGRK